ncbi:MAG TPA: potassium-transporting ATPase subunit KdpC [Albitalea sp.]|uniref:potassium-transporting ATPase subunit KdpC n=1 Tax=Piscinibacter sp. TaxID=1903157 RepID=UPI002ED28E85
MNTLFRPAITLFVALSLITGITYPLLVTGVARAAFADRANGSLVIADGKLRGSRLIGQSFADPGHFWGRPSATTPGPTNGAGSGGSNLGPSNPALVEAVKERIAALRAADPDNRAAVPVDLVTASASGLDPDISLAAAHYQVARVSRARGVAPEVVRRLVDEHAELPWLGLLGEARVNVLAINLALDAGRAAESVATRVK